MRSPLFAATAVAAVIVLALPLSADDKKGTSHKLPIKPFAKAKAGDWAAWSGTMKAGDQSIPIAMDRTVDAIEGAKVTTTYRDSMTDGKAKQEIYDTADNTVEALLETDPAKRPPLKDVAFSDEKKSVGGKEFACKKCTFTATEDKLESKGTIWLCEDVAAGGVVALEVSLKAPDGTMTFTWELAGMGAKGKVDWGKSADDVMKGAQPPK